MHTKYIIAWRYYVIYKISCKDPNITEGYVGSTKDFHARELKHKNRCLDENDKNHNLKLYQFIRANGNFDNFVMEEIDKIKCYDYTEARIKENEWYDKIDSTLNSIRPFYNKEKKTRVKKEIKTFDCLTCEYSCFTKFSLQRHFKTTKHLKKVDSKRKITECEAGQKESQIIEEPRTNYNELLEVIENMKQLLNNQDIEIKSLKEESKKHDLEIRKIHKFFNTFESI